MLLKRFRADQIGRMNDRFFALASEGSETTHPNALHNAEVVLATPPPGRNDWHVRFTLRKVNRVSRVVFRSTGTKEVAAAKRIAAQIKSFDGCRARS